MSTVDVHERDITVDAMKEELRENPFRLEERKIPIVITHDTREEEHDGNTPLVSAAKYGNVSVLRFLLSEGADVNAENDV